jgi:hypothetical protein
MPVSEERKLLTRAEADLRIAMLTAKLKLLDAILNDGRQPLAPRCDLSSPATSLRIVLRFAGA